MTSEIHPLMRGDVQMLGASKAQPVAVEGRMIPRLSAIDRGDMVEMILDGRFSYVVPAEWWPVLATATAQAMAIGAGYSHFGAESREAPFAPEVLMMDDKP